jgi:hypothetical protein
MNSSFSLRGARLGKIGGDHFHCGVTSAYDNHPT